MRLGSHVAREGTNSTSTATSSIRIQNGMEPLNISPSVTEGSGTDDFTVKISKPMGGVRRPASITIIP